MEVFQHHKNTFSKGLNADLDPNIVSSEQYIDAANVTLVPSNNFLALQNIQGTTNEQSLGISGTTVLGVFATRYTIGATSNIPCLTIFTATAGGNLNIFCYDPGATSGISLYKLYQTSTPSDYFTTGQGVIDGVLYPEKNFDILYVTDNYYEPRKIRCNIQAPNIASNSPFLTDTNMSIARRRAIGSVQYIGTTTGGSLLTGSYQIAYQLINLNTAQVGGYNKYTRFSLLTSPIYIGYDNQSVGTVDGKFAGVGMVSNLKIIVNILPTADELANYTHFRLAIIENVNPEGTIALTAAVTEIQPIASYLTSDGTIAGYSVKKNYQANTVTLDEIVIDTAAISKVKTLNIKNNRLFVGNIGYNNLIYNNGTPSITGGSILRQTAVPNISPPTDSFGSDPDFPTKYRGHFREEVYRYAISYFDKFGNFSSPSPLNADRVTDNQSTIVVDGQGNNMYSNSNFNSGLTGWSQLFGGVSWTVPSNAYATTTVTTGATDTSATLYQAATSSPSYFLTLNYNVTSATSNYRIIANYLDNTLTSIGTTTLVDSAFPPATLTGSNTIATGITPPANTAYIGFYIYNYTGVGAATIQVNNASLQAGFRDMKYPARNQKLSGVTYSLFGTNGATQSLGLQLNGINNHPTWAQGFVILRLPRKKNILFQTPLIPMCNVYGLGPLDNYPTIAQEGTTPSNVVYASGTSTASATGLQASPAGPVNVLYPMNLAWPKKRSIVKITVDGGAGLNAFRNGEAKLINDPLLTHAQIFPQGTLYSQNHPYLFSASHQIKTVDAAVIVILDSQTFGTNTNVISWNNGSGDTSCSNTFTAHRDEYYYYDSGNSGVKADIRTSINFPAAYAVFAAGSPGTTMGGKFVMTADNLETKGVQFGYKPLVQKSSVVELTNSVTSINDVNNLTFAIGAPPVKVANPFTDFTASGKVNTLEIVNFLAGLDDGRYGNLAISNTYIFTGVQYNFTTSELTTVAAGGSLPKNVTVFGGDCYVAYFNFKVSDTVYSVVNQEKYLAAPAGLTALQGVQKWGRIWLNSNGPAVISLPVALRNASQYLTLVLESEYNGSIPDYDTATPFIGVTPQFKSYTVTNEYQCRSPLTYNYNYNLNKENDQKLFISVDPLNPVLTSLKSRIAYSNTKVYNTSTDGFDTIPVLNIFDLPEAYGDLTKLAIASNNMYSIQQRGIAYLPVGQRVIETSDAANLQVHSGDILNTPVWIDVKRGGQHLLGVKETGTGIYIFDNENQAFYHLNNDNLEHISDKGLMSPFRSNFTFKLPENQVKVFHDILRNEIWMAAPIQNFTYIWNENLKCWVSRYNFTISNLGGSAYINNKLYLVGQGDDNNQCSVHSMYTGPAANLMGVYVTPTVTFVANPNSDFGKTFDDVLVNATDPLASLDTTVFRNSIIGFQSAAALSLNVTTRGEGNYRAKVLRDLSTGARMRGNKAQHRITWNSGISFANPVKLTSVITQWRPSFKQY